MGDGGRGDGIFENQIPSDDPCHELAKCGVGIVVGRASDGGHRCELGVAEGSKDTGETGNHKGKHDGRSSLLIRSLAHQHEDPRTDIAPTPRAVKDMGPNARFNPWSPSIWATIESSDFVRNN